jgi:hypothetical protein
MSNGSLRRGIEASLTGDMSRDRIVVDTGPVKSQDGVRHKIRARL